MQCSHEIRPDDKTMPAQRPPAKPVPVEDSIVLATSEGRSFSLRDQDVVGRAATGREVLEPFVEVSRRHAQFFWREGEWCVVDLNSSNGTFLDGQKLVPQRPTPFADGQRISLSKVLSLTATRVPLPAAPAQGEDPNRRVLSILFADIKGSVDFFQEQGTVVAKNWIFKLFNMLTKIIEEHRGTHLKNIGDALLAVFDDPQAAALAAVKMQSIIREHNQVTDVSEHYFLRIGMNMGSVLFENNDVFGNAVNIASRVQNLAPPERIYITGVLRQKLKESSQMQLRPVGHQGLKGVKTTTEIFEILPGGFSPPPASPPSPV